MNFLIAAFSCTPRARSFVWSALILNQILIRSHLIRPLSHKTKISMKIAPIIRHCRSFAIARQGNSNCVIKLQSPQTFRRKNFSTFEFCFVFCCLLALDGSLKKISRESCENSLKQHTRRDFSWNFFLSAKIFPELVVALGARLPKFAVREIVRTDEELVAGLQSAETAHTRTSEEDDEKAELTVDVGNRTGSDTELEWEHFDRAQCAFALVKRCFSFAQYYSSHSPFKWVAYTAGGLYGWCTVAEREQWERTRKRAQSAV